MKFIANTAAVVGDVTLGENTSIWFSAVLRGDEGAIKIGDGSNIQDNCTVHGEVTVGTSVTVGHNAILHGCTVEDGALIGMGACVLDGAVIGAESLIGAGALVTGGTVIPPRSLVLGSPAKVKRPLTEEEVASLHENAAHYVSLISKYTEEDK
ncbi:MAG: gamma carbonic anhydrase family protein [Oscillospiraceae bacterium]|nr:gamma carbonic anhydrase family protein [Oscillospiraceae bacterium]